MKSRTLTYVYAGIVLAYLATVLFLPLDPTALERYNLTETRLRVLGVITALPLIAVWLISLYGFLRFHGYAAAIKEEKEGKGYALLTKGLMVLSFGLPLNSLFATVLNYYTIRYPQFNDTSIILRNYSSLLYQLAAFYIIARGANALITTLKPKATILHTRLSIVSVIAFSSFFTWVITARPFGSSAEDTYHLPSLLVVTTLVIPYLLTWYSGIKAAHNLRVYNRKVAGNLYKKMLEKLVAGIAIIIGLSIAIQILVAFSQKLSRLDFTPLLLLIYVLLAGYTLGFGLVAQGARQLKKIEEV